MGKINSPSRLLHQPVRFAGMVHIYSRGGNSTFADAHRAIGVSPSLWASHVNVLERAGLLKTKKSFVGKRLRSEQLLTPKGRKTLEDYISALSAMGSVVQEIRRRPVRGLAPKLTEVA